MATTIGGGLNEAERKKRIGQIEALALAATDMRDAAAGARMIEGGTANFLHERRVVETGMTVSYARAYERLSSKLIPRDEEDLRLHQLLAFRRNKLDAHTDPEGGREAQTQRGVEGSWPSSRLSPRFRARTFRA